MIRTIKIAAFASVVAIAAGPSFAEDAIPLVIPPQQLMTTVSTDLGKGIAAFDPIEILTPKLADAPAAVEPAKTVKRARYAKKRGKKLAKK